MLSQENDGHKRTSYELMMTKMIPIIMKEDLMRMANGVLRLAEQVDAGWRASRM